MSIVGKNSSRQILLKYCTKNSFAPVFVAARVRRILPSADVIIVNRFKLEINMLNPSRNSHSLKSLAVEPWRVKKKAKIRKDL